MANEKITDYFIAKLLDASKIDYTPNGSSIKEVHEALKKASKKGTGNVGYPEFTAISNDFILIVENKAEIDKQANYLDDKQAELAMDVQSITDFAENGALHYAQIIIRNTGFKKVFAFGCSGDEKHHMIKPIYVDENGYKILQPVENFENFSESNISKYYKEQVLGETPNEILELEDILKNAKKLHEDLRNYGQLGDNEKPLVVSAILLALCDKDFKVSSLTGDDINTDGNKIFSALSNYMDRVKVTPSTKKEKVLGQFKIIKDRTILNTIDDRLKSETKKGEFLQKTPLKYFTEYLEKNVLSSVKSNNPEDVLGRFYGEFMSFSGGDGQTLGVVLTPSHVTELFSDLVEIKPTDRVFDPCCGTGGFLIAAMHKMIEQAQPEEIENIKREQLYGIEIREDMFSIATTNMILRGDGKSNLENLDFLKEKTATWRKKDITVGFMNPPYSQAKSKDTAHLSEIHFIKHLLDCLADGARCVVIVPQSTMVGNKKEDKKVKEQLLKKHTLEGVITLNKNTFYGIGTNPCIAVFTAHKPHSKNKYCKFINFENDGFIVSKHIGLIGTERALEKKIQLLNCWLHDAPAESKFMVKTTIEADDEWLHSFYYFNDEIPKDGDFDKSMTSFLTFKFNMVMQGKEFLFEKQLKDNNYCIPNVEALSKKDWEEFSLTSIFPDIQRGKRLKKDDHIKGKIPYISSTAINNGVDGFIGNDMNIRKFENCLTLANSGSVGACFYQPYSFIASDHVTKLSNNHFNEYVYLFIASMLVRLSEKYSFNREINDNRIKKEKIMLPINSNYEPDYEYMEQYMRQIEQKQLKKYLSFINEQINLI